MATSHAPRTPVLAVLVGLAGAVAAAVLGFLTFGAQATAHPDHVPLGLAVPERSPQLRVVADRVVGQGGGAVSWQVTTPETARNLLDDKEIYGYLDLAAGPSGAPTAKIVVSGAVNAQGAQLAQQVLTEVTNGLARATGAPPRRSSPSTRRASPAAPRRSPRAPCCGSPAWSPPSASACWSCGAPAAGPACPAGRSCWSP